MCVCVSVFVLFVDLFQYDLRCLFRPHQVNHGGVQKAASRVSLYKSQFGPSQETLAATASSTSEGLCRWTRNLFDLHVTLKLCFPFER